MKKSFGIITVVYLAIVVIGLVGYVKGVIKLCQCDFEPSYKAEIIYGVGTVTGLGVIVGWMDFGK